MRNKPYYSDRSSKNLPKKSLALEELREFFNNIFVSFENDGYFQENFGYSCVDKGYVYGKCRQDLASALRLKLKREDLTPISQKIINYSEYDLFDVIEFLYEHCSEPIDGDYHGWNDCGLHCSKFKQESGQTKYREKVNEVLVQYNGGYKLRVNGEICVLADSGLEGLIEAPLVKVLLKHH